MTTDTAANITKQNSPSAALATKLQTGIAAAQTAYSLNNGGGLTPGEPLRMIDHTQGQVLQSCRFSANPEMRDCKT